MSVVWEGVILNNEMQNIVWQRNQPEIKISYNLDYDLSSFWILPPHGDAVSELPFYVQETGFTCANKAYYVSRENLQSYWICYIVDGAGIIEYNGYKTRITAGHCIWIDCHFPHKLYTDKNIGKLSTYYIHFNGTGAKKYSQYFHNLNRTGCTYIGDSEPVSEYIKKIIEFCRHEDYLPMTDITASYLLTCLCYCILKTADAQTQTKMPEFVYQTKLFLEKNYKKHINLDLLAKQFFISRAYLQKQFKKYIKVSPNVYLNQIRITNAKRLLRTTSDSISDIAYNTGFNDTSYFIRVFQNSEKVTPLTYRKLWQ